MIKNAHLEHPERLHMDFIKGFIDWQKESPSSDKFILWTALSTVAAAVGRKCWINYNGYQAYPNIFTMLVAPAGLGKKTTIARAAYQLLQGIPQINILPESVTPQMMLHLMSEHSLQCRVKIKGHPRDFQYGGAYLFASEALNVLGPKMYGSMTELMTELYDSDPNGWSNDNPFRKATLKDGTIAIYNPTLNFLGCTTPVTLTDSIIKKSHIDTGFASRVLFALEEGSSGKSTTWRAEHSQNRFDTMKDNLRKDILNISKLSGQFYVEEEVREIHDKFTSENEELALKFQKSRLASFYGRRPIHVLKLAQLFSVSRDNSLRINKTDWENAKLMVSMAHEDLEKLFSGISKHDDSTLLYKIWEHLRARRDPFTMAYVLNEFWDAGYPEKVKGIVYALVQMKRIQAEQHGSNVFYTVIDPSKLK